MAKAGPAVENVLPFKWVFLAIVAVMIFFFAAAIYLSAIAEPTDGQTTLLHFFVDGMKMCLGAILGLLGGRAADVRK
jgi:hypothetical protein